MSLEALVAEIQRRGEADLAAIEGTRRTDADQIAADRDARIAAVQSENARLGETEAARERTQRLAAAKLKARKLLYEAREERLSKGVDETRRLLVQYTSSADYPAVLKRMVEVASDRLGKPIRVRGRAEDASLLTKAAGRSFDASPAPILGGLVAESSDGARRLDLSFDELLRLREDRVRQLLT